MLVTRHFSLTGETDTPGVSKKGLRWIPKPEGHVSAPVADLRGTWVPRPITKTQLVGFCDWLSMYQRHGRTDLPKISDGAVIHVDKDGVIDRSTLRRWKVEGSHKTGVMVRCDGETVWFDGNVSKFGRPDNVFGYSFRECLLRINLILESLGLPPFGEGESFVTNFEGQPRTVWTGAKVTRIDLTQNHSVGSKEDAYHFMRWLAGQQASRLKTGTWGEGETVDFGRGSRRIMLKAYLKAEELRRHNRAAAKEGSFSQEKSEYVERLAEWCDSVGLVRVEATFKATKLHDMACNYLGSFDMKQLEIEFQQYCEVMTRASAEVEELTDLPKQLLATYRMWQAGDDVTARMSRATFFRHRRELLPYGVDIAVKSNVVPMKTRTRVIKLGPVSMPDFYELPPIERARYGNQS